MLPNQVDMYKCSSHCCFSTNFYQKVRKIKHYSIEFFLCQTKHFIYISHPTIILKIYLPIYDCVFTVIYLKLFF